MALTPAEKQRRYRARLRDRLAAAANAVPPDHLDALRDAIREQRQPEIDDLKAEIEDLRRQLAIALGQRKP